MRDLFPEYAASVPLLSDRRVNKDVRYSPFKENALKAPLKSNLPKGFCCISLCTLGVIIITPAFRSADRCLLASHKCIRGLKRKTGLHEKSFYPFLFSYICFFLIILHDLFGM